MAISTAIDRTVHPNWLSQKVENIGQAKMWKFFAGLILATVSVFGFSPTLIKRAYFRDKHILCCSSR
jgi:hypothetical protein